MPSELELVILQRCIARAEKEIDWDCVHCAAVSDYNYSYAQTSITMMGLLPTANSLAKDSPQE